MAAVAVVLVVLGKLLVQQKRYDEARKLYADGTTATGAPGGVGSMVWRTLAKHLHNNAEN
jgi:hypothetical protein